MTGWILTAFILSRVADVLTTRLALKEAGTREKTRLTRWFAAHFGWTAGLVLKSATYIAVAWWAMDRWPVAPVVIAATGLSAIVAVNNARIWLKKRAARKALGLEGVE